MGECVRIWILEGGPATGVPHVMCRFGGCGWTGWPHRAAAGNRFGAGRSRSEPILGAEHAPVNKSPSRRPHPDAGTTANHSLSGYGATPMVHSCPFTGGAFGANGMRHIGWVAEDGNGSNDATEMAGLGGETNWKGGEARWESRDAKRRAGRKRWRGPRLGKAVVVLLCCSMRTPDRVGSRQFPRDILFPIFPSSRPAPLSSSHLVCFVVVKSFQQPTHTLPRRILSFSLFLSLWVVFVPGITLGLDHLHSHGVR